MGNLRRPSLRPACLLLLVLAASYTDASPPTCKPASCAKSGNGIFKFTPGHTYTYHLDGRSLTEVPEAVGDGVSLELKATAEVHFGADCSNTLQLKDVSVTGPNAKKYGNLQDLEAHAVRFSWSDGHLEQELCADPADSNAALNVKRAIISLLQVSTPQLGSAQKYETDVFGICPTDFTIHKIGSVTHVTKTRDLNKCSFREDLKLRVTNSPYTSDAVTHGSPALDADLKVTLEVKGGVLQTAETEETYLYKPFSNKEHGAKTTVHTKLTFVSDSANAAHNVGAGVVRTIIFDAPHGSHGAKSSSAGVIAALQKAKGAMPDGVHQAAATEFRHVVEVFRQTNKNDLLTAYGQVKAGAGFPDKVAARKLFLHALLRAGTGDSVQVAVELLTSNEIAGEFKKVWHMSLAFVRHATPAALTAAGTLLHDDSPKELYFGVGALLGKYCDEHECDGLHEFDDLLAKLAKPIAGGCKATTHEQENTIIAALKGLENAKELNEKTAELLRVCASDHAAPARVRAFALNTFRTDACQPQLRKSALEILSDRDEDSEIRIKAYLAAVRCPTGKLANSIKALLDSEPINQVGSFIVSHLRNVRASKNPRNADLKHHFSEIRSSKRFPEDWRRFSHNQELSYFLDAVNVGSSFERTVIFSQQSYLPRSGEMKLTSNIFGHTFNLLEIHARAENLDRLTEAWLGPKGYLRTHDLEDIWHNGTEAVRSFREKLRERARQTFRPKRSVPESGLEAFRGQVKLHNDHKEIDLDLNVKAFDTNIGSLHYQGDTKEFNPENLIDKIFNRVDGCIDKLKSFNQDIKSHAQLYETELSYPTGLGFPLKLSASVTTAVHLKLDGKIDLHAIVKDPKNAHVQFEIVPSAAVEVHGLLSIDAHAVEAGLKVGAILHTSTGVNVNVKSVDGSGFDVVVGLPVKKQELISLKSEVAISVREEGHSAVETAVAFNTKRKDFHGCFDQLSSVIGLTFCGDVGVPFEGINSKAAFYPLNGPAKLLITVESDDVTTYKFRAVHHHQDPDRRSLELLIDTPGSKTNRRLELLLENNRKPNREIRAKLVSPYRTLIGELVLVQTENEQSLTARANNGEEEYLVKIGASVSGTREHQTYSPLFELSTPTAKTGKKGKKGAKSGYSVGGTVVVDRTDDSKKITFNHVSLTVPAGEFAVDGWLAVDPTSVSSDLKLTNGQQDTVTVKGKLQHPEPKHFIVDAEVVASQFPDLGVHVKWDYNRDKDQLETNLDLVHGTDLQSKEARITAHVLAKYHWVNAKDFDLSAKAKVAYPLLGIEGHVEGGSTPRSVHYTLEGSYLSNQVKSHLSAKTGVQAPKDYDIEFEAKVLDSSVKLASKRDVVSGTESKFTNSLEIHPGGRYELNADVTCNSQPGDVNHRVLVEAKIAGKPNPYKLDVGVIANPKVFESHGKASVGDVDWVDISVKVGKPPNPTGSFKVLVKDHVDGAGQFKYVDGTGSLAATVHLIKIDRKLKAAGDLKVTGSQHDANLDVFFNFDKDPSKKIHLASSTDIKTGAIDSKNTLIVLDHTTELNVKGTLEGKLLDGHIIGAVDLTLPNGRHIAYNVDRVLHVRPGNTEFDVKVSGSTSKDKTAPPASFAVNAKGKQIDLKHRVFDVEGDITYTAHAEDLRYELVAKSLPEGEHHRMEFKGLLTGSKLELRPALHLKVDIHKPTVDYYLKVNVASDSNLELTGKIQRDPEAKIPSHCENNLELNLPTGELKNIKLVESWTYTRGQDGAPCQLVGSVSTTYNSAKTVTLAVDVTHSKTEGHGKVTLTTPKSELPRVLQYSFKVDKSTGVKREGSVTVTQGDKEVHVDVAVEVPEARNSIQLAINARTPHEKLKTVHIKFHGSKTEKLVESETALLINDKKTDIVTKYGLDPRNPVIELSIVHPNGKTVLAYHLTRKEGQGFEFAWRYQHNSESMEVKGEGRAPSVHDFDITIDANSDSERLKINHVHIVLSNKEGAAGKRVTVLATEAGENIVDGHLDYHFEDGSNAVLYEASGNLKVKNEDKPVKITFKKNLIDNGEEKGMEGVFSAVVGGSSWESSFKRTNHELHAKNHICKKTDECGGSEYYSKHRVDVNELWNEVTISVNNLALGGKTDVSIKALTERKEKHLLQTLELRARKEVYNYKLHVTDKDASIILTTPHRTVEADIKRHLNIDTTDKRHFNYKVEASAWLDKVREPTLKSSVLLEVDVARTDDSVTCTHEARFQHPSLGKDLVVKGKSLVGGRSILDSRVEIDVFAKSGQKIVIESKIAKSTFDHGFNLTGVWELKSKGQKLDVTLEGHLAAGTGVCGVGAALTYKDDKTGKKELGFGYQATKERLAFFVKAPKEMLVNIETHYQPNDGLPKLEALVEIIGVDALVLEAHCEKSHKLAYVIYKKATPERKITGVYQLDLTSKLIAHSEWHQGAEKKELVNIALQWSTETKPQITYDLENAKELLTQTRGDVAAAVEKLKIASKSAAEGATGEYNDVIEGLKKAKPNLVPLLAAYEAQIKQIRDEAKTDQAIQELTDLIKQLIGTASESVAHVTEVVVKIADKALDLFEQLSTAVLNSLKRIVPVISQSIHKIFLVGVDVSNALVSSLLICLQNTVELIKKHEAEFQQVVTVVAEIGRDVARVVGKTLDQTYREVKDFVTVLAEQVKALPMFGMIQERLQELKAQLKEYTPPDQVFETLHEITGALADALPTQELKDFVTALSAYIEKVLKKQTVDLAELKSIHGKLVTAVKSVVVLLKKEVDDKEAPGVLGSAWPMSLRNAFKVPLFAAVHFSPLAFLRSDDHQTLKELWYTYRPTLNPRDWLPPFRSHGILLDHSHFFTFDGRHYTFAGTCSYVLAQDVINGNFTVVLNLAGGKFKSLQLSDSHDTVEIVTGGKIEVNGVPHELPFRTHDINGWARYNSINVKTAAGLHIKVDVDHHFAVFDISGFYHGQLRGLMGDLNNEPYDDFRLPSGKVTEDVTEFGNGYHVGPACPPGAASPHHAHHGHHETECTNLFAANSPLRSAFPVINPVAYREACDHYLSETADRKEEYACRVATAYVEHARQHSAFIEVPSKCVHCSGGGKTWAVGETLSIPHGGEADVLFIVEQVAKNADVYKDLVSPLVASLTSELKTKGISDVNFSLLGYGHPEERWPAHFTSGGKIAYDGKAQPEFGEPKKSDHDDEKLDNLVHKVSVELGLTKLSSVIYEASKYPFRAGASKAVVIVTGSGCEKSVVPFGLQKLRLLYAEKVLRDRGIAFHVVSQLQEFNVAGSSDAKQQKSIVGFDHDAVYSLSDAKKKTLDGNEDLRKDIEFHQDACVDIAQNTHGTAFHAGNFIDGKASARKNFLAVVSHKVADSLVGDFTEDCTCTLKSGKHAQTSCKLTSSSRATKEKKGKN